MLSPSGSTKAFAGNATSVYTPRNNLHIREARHIYGAALVNVTVMKRLIDNPSGSVAVSVTEDANLTRAAGNGAVWRIDR